ncbi:cobalamin biosynthesis protein [Rhodococcus sovatensis]|uniref:Cobalamin biosynthesis protein n=1 Tax=Rhodococcus sovatensis TaxID=1805840 RepID=A0ABZ2PPH2_9NOCA
MSERVVLGLGMTSSATPVDGLAVFDEVSSRDWVVVAVSTLEGKEPQAQPVADALGVPLLVWSAARLSQVDAPHPSDRARAETGTSSVAEAAAILASGGGELILGKTSSRGVTLAVACVED